MSFPNINKEHYCFAETINAKGNGNILARYQYEIQRGFYDVILIFCDADKGSDQFLSVVYQIGDRFFENKEDAMEVFIFANPVTLQVVLSHVGDAYLSKVAKKSNAQIVKELTGIDGYKASQDQISEMIGKIHFSSLEAFKKRLDGISTDFKDVPSTNFLTFLNRFENDDDAWIENINSLRKKA